MKMYMVEWWNKVLHEFTQEYFLKAETAFARYLQLEKDIEESNPDIQTKFLNAE